MPVKKLKKFLDDNGVKYVRISHSPAYTAQEIAASAHVPGRDMAKVVMVKLDGNMAMVVLPASRHVEFPLLRAATGAREAELASEGEFRDLFPECELGAMPPFGNLYDMAVYVTASLMAEEEIAFNAGSHTELIRMPTEDFNRLVKPEVMRFSAA
jgi:Ala-tRNA(Pro) deacylase